MTKKEPLSDLDIAHTAAEKDCPARDICVMCGRQILVMIYKGSGLCSENCRKDKDDDHEPFRGGVMSP